jgi:two-component system cell cycle response regulator DivK
VNATEPSKATSIAWDSDPQLSRSRQFCRPDRDNLPGVPSISPRVLIVEDDGDTRDMYTVALSIMGFQPVAATNAEEAFAQARDLRPDAIVTDLTMGGLSGLDLARRLRGDARTADAGIIVLSGHSSASRKQRAREAGCDRYLVKPCSPDTLALEIRSVLASRHQLAALDS